MCGIDIVNGGHYDIATETPECHRLRIALDDLALTM
jgi:hypothetical protein